MPTRSEIASLADRDCRQPIFNGRNLTLLSANGSPEAESQRGPSLEQSEALRVRGWVEPAGTSKCHVV